ncbi:MAG: preprotein translocase subunit YajC [Bdellovibrionales bacterium]|nr:preprotein translocase subunit YajC [Bdellovibrionales bacterium]
MMPFLFVFIIFYFLLIRPQQRRNKEHQNFLTKLKKGDNVLTSGGVLGTIAGLTEKFVTLEVADGVRIRILKTQISSPVEEEQK